MTGRVMTPRAFELLEELANNNNKPWFDAHRDEISQVIVGPLTAVLEEASAYLLRSDLPMSGGAKTLFRMNRDIRFAKDKSPYKTQASGLLTPDGGKSPDRGVAYLQIDHRGGHMSAGYYNIGPDVLRRFRHAISTRPDEFRSVLRGLEEAGLGLARELALTGMPAGYSKYSGEWFAEYLKFKVFLVRTRLSPQDWLDGKVAKAFAEQTLACAPLVRFGR